MLKYKNYLAIAFVCLAAIGCGGADESAKSNDDFEALMRQQDAQRAEKEQQDDLAALKQAAEAARAKADQLAAEAPSNVTPDDMVRGKKIDTSGIISTPIKAGIKAEQTLNTYQWQQALQLYAASNNLDYPETHEEFMEKVIGANGIVLEKLLEPYEYRYIPEVNNLQKSVKQSAIDEAEAAAKKAEVAYQAALN